MIERGWKCMVQGVSDGLSCEVLVRGQDKHSGPHHEMLSIDPGAARINAVFRQTPSGI